jgi:hypothetical protein
VSKFCWAVRTLRQKGESGRWEQRAPAMAAGLTDHVWALDEWAALPAVQRKKDLPKRALALGPGAEHVPPRSGLSHLMVLSLVWSTSIRVVERGTLSR